MTCPRFRPNVRLTTLMSDTSKFQFFFFFRIPSLGIFTEIVYHGQCFGSGFIDSGSGSPHTPHPPYNLFIGTINALLERELFCRRAEERQAFEMERRKKEVDLEEARRQAEERKRKEEQAEVRHTN